MAKILEWVSGQSEHPHRCNPILDQWTNIQILLEGHIGEKRYLENARDPRFLALIGASVHRMNQFNSCLIRDLSDAIEENASQSREPNREVLRSLRRYTVFHNNLIVSRVKHFFFREMPNAHENDLFLRPELEVYELGKKLGRHVNRLRSKPLRGQEEAKNAKRLFAKYFFLLQLLYEFIFDSGRHSGVFLKFKFDKNSFETVSKVFVTISESISSITDFRFEIYALLVRVLGSQIGMPPFHASVEESYAAFVNWYRRHNDEDLGIEPLTWHLCSFLWKIEGLIQDSDGYTDKELQRIHFEHILRQIKDLIVQCLKIYERSYIANTVYYHDMFEQEAKFIAMVCQDPWDHEDISSAGLMSTKPYLLGFRNEAVVMSSLERLNELYHSDSELICEETQKVRTESRDFVAEFNKRPLSREMNLKVENIIERLDKNALNRLVAAYVESLKSYQGHRLDAM